MGDFSEANLLMVNQHQPHCSRAVKFIESRRKNFLHSRCQCVVFTKLFDGGCHSVNGDLSIFAMAFRKRHSCTDLQIPTCCTVTEHVHKEVVDFPPRQILESIHEFMTCIIRSACSSDSFQNFATLSPSMLSNIGQCMHCTVALK